MAASVTPAGTVLLTATVLLLVVPTGSANAVDVDVNARCAQHTSIHSWCVTAMHLGQNRFGL